MLKTVIHQYTKERVRKVKKASHSHNMNVMKSLDHNFSLIYFLVPKIKAIRRLEVKLLFLLLLIKF